MGEWRVFGWATVIISEAWRNDDQAASKLAITRRFLPLENLHLNSRLAKTDLQVQTFQKLYCVQLV